MKNSTIKNNGCYACKSVNRIEAGEVLVRDNALVQVSEVIQVSEKTFEIVGFNIDTNESFVERRRVSTILIVYNWNNVEISLATQLKRAKKAQETIEVAEEIVVSENAYNSEAVEVPAKKTQDISHAEIVYNSDLVSATGTFTPFRTLLYTVNKYKQQKYCYAEFMRFGYNRLAENEQKSITETLLSLDRLENLVLSEISITARE